MAETLYCRLIKGACSVPETFHPPGALTKLESGRMSALPTTGAMHTTHQAGAPLDAAMQQSSAAARDVRTIAPQRYAQDLADVGWWRHLDVGGCLHYVTSLRACTHHAAVMPSA